MTITFHDLKYAHENSPGNIDTPVIIDGKEFDFMYLGYLIEYFDSLHLSDECVIEFTDGELSSPHIVDHGCCHEEYD